MANPISGPLACVPNYPALLTRRARVKCRGSFVVPPSSQGIGLCVADPFQSASNNTSSVIVSTGAYAINSIGLANANSAAAQSDSEYATASFGVASTSIQARVVSSVLRIRYTDLELNRGGSIYALHHPNHLSLQGQTAATLRLFDETRDFQNSAGRNWINIHWKPVTLTDTELSGTFPVFTPANTDPSYYMGFLIVGDGAVATTYDFELWSIIEYIGTVVRGKTPSLVDQAGFNSVHTVAVTSPTLQPSVGDVSSGQKTQSVMSEVASYLEKGASWAWNHRSQIGSAIESGFSDVSSLAERVLGGMGLMI